MLDASSLGVATPSPLALVPFNLGVALVPFNLGVALVPFNLNYINLAVALLGCFRAGCLDVGCFFFGCCVVPQIQSNSTQLN